VTSCFSSQTISILLSKDFVPNVLLIIIYYKSVYHILLGIEYQRRKSTVNLGIEFLSPYEPVLLADIEEESSCSYLFLIVGGPRL
jgi:hypothetical protein